MTITGNKESKYRVERGSQTYLWLLDYLDSELVTMGIHNQKDLNEYDTAKARGRIQTLTHLKREVTKES